MSLLLPMVATEVTGCGRGAFSGRLGWVGLESVTWLHSYVGRLGEDVWMAGLSGEPFPPHVFSPAR